MSDFSNKIYLSLSFPCYFVSLFLSWPLDLEQNSLVALKKIFPRNHKRLPKIP